MKKWEPLYLTLSNSKSEVCQGDYRDKIKKMFKRRRVSVVKVCAFCAEGSGEKSLISSVFVWSSIF